MLDSLDPYVSAFLTKTGSKQNEQSKRVDPILIAYRALPVGTICDGKSYSLARCGCSDLKSLIGNLIVEDAFLAILTINRQITHLLLLFGLS